MCPSWKSVSLLAQATDDRNVSGTSSRTESSNQLDEDNIACDQLWVPMPKKQKGLDPICCEKNLLQRNPLLKSNEHLFNCSSMVVLGMIDEFFNFNLLLTLVCTQHVNKFNWFQASLLEREREWVLSQLSKLIWLEIDRHLPSPFLSLIRLACLAERAWSFFKKMGHSRPLFLYFCLFNTVYS